MPTTEELDSFTNYDTPASLDAAVFALEQGVNMSDAFYATPNNVLDMIARTTGNNNAKLPADLLEKLQD